MANIYTFPTYHLPGGDMVIQISIFDGTAATHNPTERYFTSIGKLSKETDFEAGELLCDVIGFEIEYDFSNLFSETIYNSLVSGNKAVMEITFAGSIAFIGVIDVSSFNSDDWYSTAEDMSTTDRSVSFSVRWILDLLKDYQPCNDIAGNDKALLVSSSSLGVPTADYYYLLHLAVSGGSSSTAGLIYYLTFDILADYGIIFKTEDTLSNVGLATQNYYDDLAHGSGVLAPYPSNYATAGADLIELLSVISAHLTPPYAIDQLNYLFSPGNTPFTTKYDILVGLVKSFGWILTFKYINSTEIHLVVSNRPDGNSVSAYPNVLKNSNEDIFLEMIDSLDITSSVNNTEYKQSKTGNTLAPFSYNTAFDFRTAAYDQTKLGQIVIPSTALDGKSFDSQSYSRVQYFMDTSSDMISNNEFINNINGWTMISGSWDWTNTQSYNSGAGQGSLKLAITTNGTFEIEYVISSPQTLASLFLLWFKIDIAPAPGSLSISMSFYNGTTLNQSRTFIFSSSGVTVPTDWRLLTSFFDIQSAFDNAPGVLSFDRVRISVTTISTAPPFKLFFDNVSVFRAWNTLPKFLGSKMIDYFYARGQNKNIRTIDGIQNINLKDYYSYNGSTYYVKKVEYDFVNNETNLESINYK